MDDGYDNPTFDHDEDEDGEAGGDSFQMRRMVREDPIIREEMRDADGTSETGRLLPLEDAAWREVLSEYPRCDPKKAGFTAGIDKHGRVTLRLKRRNAATYVLSDVGKGTPSKFPESIRRGLGPHASEIIEEMEEEIRSLDEEDEQLEKGPQTEEVRKRREEIEERKEKAEEEVQVVERERPLGERVKEIFKKQGLTILSVLTAAGAVIGVIVSNLKSGLTKMSKGIGNGLKDIGKKLAGILPGIVDSIVSFLFKTAGEAIGFLSKHAWLLILLVVTFVIEQYPRSLRSPIKG